MFLIKLGGSLIAPKDKVGIDYDYLSKISDILWNIDNIFLAHWTGNVGHWWVNDILKNWGDLKKLIIENYDKGKIILNNYFKEIDKYFWFSRLYAESFLKDKFNERFWKYIIWWDITKSGKIVSSDDIFSVMLDKSFIEKAIILTDVDGVLDEKNKVIPIINEYNFDKINFWTKKWDVTGWMKAKVEKILDSWKEVIICNGYNIDNILSWIEKGKGIWTKIY
jgi:isopentenyl phosphate kinase